MVTATPLDWRKIGHDLLLAGGANFFRKLISYVVVVTLARYLNKDDVGAMFLAASIASVAAVLTELGTTRYVVREIAVDSSRAARALGAVLALRIPLLAIVCSVLSIVVWAAYREIALAVSLSSLYVFLESLFFSFSGVFVATRNVRYRVLADVSSQVLLVALVFLAVRWDAGFVTILLCYVAANSLLVAAAVAMYLSRIGPLELQWDLDIFRRILRQSLPFFALMSLSVLHFKVDTLMLGFMASLEAVANYEIAYKFLEVSRIVVRPVAMVFLPICTALVAQAAWPMFSGLAKKLFLGTLLAAVVGAAVVVGGAGAVMGTVFGPSYSPSVPILRILFLALPAVYVSFIGSVLANALVLDKRLIRATVACLLLNVLANLYAIPRWAGIGAAWTTLATETLLGVWTWILVVGAVRHARRHVAPDALAGREQ
ncbi:MAG: flippase [Gammaproteobacteria bacterium]